MICTAGMEPIADEDEGPGRLAVTEAGSGMEMDDATCGGRPGMERGGPVGIEAAEGGKMGGPPGMKW